MIKNVINGHINEALGKEKELGQERMQICKKCPLYLKGRFGPVCNKDLYIDPNTESVSLEPLEGYIRGCGCRLRAKTVDPRSKCPINKW